jgi:hypothetical protein
VVGDLVEVVLPPFGQFDVGVFFALLGLVFGSVVSDLYCVVGVRFFLDSGRGRDFLQVFEFMFVVSGFDVVVEYLAPVLEVVDVVGNRVDFVSELLQGFRF